MCNLVRMCKCSKCLLLFFLNLFVQNLVGRFCHLPIYGADNLLILVCYNANF